MAPGATVTPARPAQDVEAADVAQRAGAGVTVDAPAPAVHAGRMNRAATVGLVIGDLANPFFASIARGIEQIAQDHGCLLITASSEEDPERERQLVGALDGRVDGLVVVPCGEDHGLLRAQRERGHAIVVVDRPPSGADLDTVLLDNVGGSWRATSHLIAHGHRRIGVIAESHAIATAAQRVEGYRLALAEAGIPVDEALLRLGPHDVVEAERATYDLLASADPPTALFAANNRMTVGVVRALRTLEWTGVGVVGFDDVELGDLLPTPITVVTHDPVEMGRRAAELLFNRIGGDRAPAHTVVLPTTLVARGSGELPPGGRSGR